MSTIHCPLHFARTADVPKNLAHADCIVGAVYAIYWAGSHGVPLGWTSKVGKEWVCWNSHGDFWTSKGDTRDAAAHLMLDSSWRFFIRK